MTLSLRARLVVGLAALVLAGLFVADLGTYLTLRDFSVKRVDQQLHEDLQAAIGYLNVGSFPEPRFPDRGGPPQQPSFPSGTYVARFDPTGTLMNETTFLNGETGSGARPVLPSPLPSDRHTPPFNADSDAGGSQYRVLVEREIDGDYVILAIPLSEVDSTLAQLVLTEALIGAGVLAGMVVLATLIVRLGLRPLERMGQTAEAIAAGDLGQRVSPATPRTEIGRLGLALNSMLSQIESAFAERTQSERRLRRFIADASHELRTPLTSIRGYAELLRRGAERSPEDAELARRRIEDEAMRMGVLVDDMLLLARLDQGRPLERVPVDLQVIVHDARADASAVAPGRPVRLTAPEPIVVTGDDMRLRQVVGNLVRNAIVHTPPATPIEIGLDRRNGHAVLTVADHGPGLPPDVAARVFEPFYRGDAGRSRDRGGSGLGLSIVAAVVAAHQGAVKVGETPGGGATFEVELPLTVNSQPAPMAT
ncbi:MAG TPA: HAMP domain-containing sensor histidine kinase [Candidatus Dormibacteraeota bacterium]|nr:HAMP domain-containing sensor histidine kinase [Candidatus Dormibacteraeota bacterium]